MDSRTIRSGFIAFFTERGHERVPSSSLVPDDPTLLLTNAGMNQFKPYFRGEQSPPWPRAVTAQKCMRAGGKHNDLEEVGRTPRHLTFFEMLGNFSFGDYYKEQASLWAWELVTDVWHLDPSRLWVTVYETDDEAFDIWRDAVGVDPRRILRLGKAHNFWSMGVAGPCGPCSEIYVDLGDEFGEATPNGPADNEDRYLEIWNLVFMQNDCNADIEPIGELPTKNIDTGSGLERVALVLQGARSVFETDILRGMVERASELTGKGYGKDSDDDVSLSILADHGRSVTFMVADGVLPSNEERGYVLRRVMRRAIRHARLLGCERPVLPGLVEQCIALMGEDYPEIGERKDLIVEIADLEEERFGTTLKQGLALLGSAIEKAKEELPGDVAFKLHDTYGFPIDLTDEIAAEAGLKVDHATFSTLMDEQRRRAREARAAGTLQESERALGELVGTGAATEFIGYEHLAADAAIVALSDGTAPVPLAKTGDEVEVVLDRTVFYAEGGGQVGDRGTIQGPSGTAAVLDTRRIAPGLIGHRARVSTGTLRVGDEVTATVNETWRRGAERAHTATHILHWVLRHRLGEHATQAGSLVEPGRLRFDFNHFEPLGDGRIGEISAEIQERVFYDDRVRAYETSFEYARSIGAMAIFGEKYGDFVRVVEVGDYSKELCGGTHVPHSSNVGPVVVVSEGSVGANLRRIEALVGRDGIDYLARRAESLERTARLLRAQPDEVEERVAKLLAAQKEMERQAAEIERRSAEADARALADAAQSVDGTRLVVARRDLPVDSLRALAQSLRGRLGSAVVVLGSAGEGRANLVSAVSKDLVDRGISARDLLAAGSEHLGGGGGGKPELAISGGPNADHLDTAIDAVARAARAALSR